MSFSCSISGEAPKEPVISSRTGHVYEKRLLQKYIDENGREPQTDHAPTEEEIIAVHTDPAVKPRPPTLTSIPALLSTFQNEWDALVLETFTLKQQQQQVRQELSQALYQNDAACRVIARLMRERDEARNALATLQGQVGTLHRADTTKAAPVEASSSSAVEGDENSMDVDDAAKPRTAEEAYYARAAEAAKTLSAARMKREVPADLTTADAWKTATQTSVVEALHTSTKPGITTLQIDTPGDLALTGAMDNHAEVYSHAHDQTVATLKGHTKKLTAAVWVGKGAGFNQRIITGSADKSIRVWVPKATNAEAVAKEGDLDLRAIGWSKKCIIKEHAAEIAGIAIHPSNEYFASAAIDGSWAIHSVDGETIISERLDSPVSKIAFHPDGMFLGIGTAKGQVKVLDIKQRQVLATLDAAAPSEPKPIHGLHFSENGYYFVTTCEHEVAVWDLRKQKKTHSWTCADLQQDVPFVSPARFDGSGKYLAIVCGFTLHVFKVKGWQQLTAVPMASDDNNDPKSHSSLSTVEDIAWVGPLSAAVAVVTKLNSLVYFAPPVAKD
ncbi:hypothetical protein IW140_006186 [Coemansia sp. RSA 1813]|nr:hypothetical protein LPJ74_005842 [Coemansia sp. RSA 1843]KAJ2092250.1 hypothetical protein IW138_001318 [Coemansia sp. RSA 986]KAJ2211297.1 hypothetical protein EV179_005607 [Coemansia sp. RSA 487]KAJ2563190.1 hypothetical protein IW140_006186 [Coemansia sp. RSA 1813]